MHIAYLTSEYPTARVTHAAGIATSIKTLALAMILKGHKVSVFVYQQDETAKIVEDGVTIHLIQRKTYKCATFYYHRKHIEATVNHAIKIDAIDVVEAPDWTGITAFMNLKAPLVIRFHGSDAYFCKLEGRKQKFKNFIFENLALRKAQAYIAPTAFASNETADIFRLQKRKIKTIYHGLYLERFENENPDQYKSYSLLYIGTIIRKKGVFELAQIFNKVVAKNPKATLTLIGGDSNDIQTAGASTFKLVEQLFTDEALKNVFYLGKVPYSEVQSHIKNAHVCVFPSFAETLGMVTIESMALKKPVVNTNIGWAQELLVDGKSGFLVHPTDIDTYANRILQLFDDNELSKKVGQEARCQVERKFDILKNADINIDYYKSLIY